MVDRYKDIETTMLKRAKREVRNTITKLGEGNLEDFIEAEYQVYEVHQDLLQIQKTIRKLRREKKVTKK